MAIQADAWVTHGMDAGCTLAADTVRLATWRHGYLDYNCRVDNKGHPGHA